MSIIAPVRRALEAKLDTITGLRVYRYESADPKTPAAVVRFPEAMQRTTFNDGWTMNVPVLLLASFASERAADSDLTALTDDVINAIEDDPTLTSAVESATVTAVDGFAVTTVGSIEYLSVSLTVEVYATRGAAPDAAIATATGTANDASA